MEKKIVIVRDGPYVVRGGVPLFEKVLAERDGLRVWKDGRPLPQGDTYSLCRCGRSGNAPFCDRSHQGRFRGSETADRSMFEDRCRVFEGKTVDIHDDMRCVKAGFCHRRNGSVWELLRSTDDPDARNEVIRGACECPSGRTVAVDADGTVHEDVLDPSVCIVQDPGRDRSGGIYVTGGIPLVSSDGDEYEVRNRYVLCRCGSSKNKPFCDARHLNAMYKDSRGSIRLFR